MTPDQLSERYPAYRWLVDKGIVGWDAFTQLEPWYLLPAGDIFRADLKWPGRGAQGPRVVFARRQDNDDLAAIEELADGQYRVLLLEGWTENGDGYALVAQYENLWAWLKSVVDDIANWHSL